MRNFLNFIVLCSILAFYATAEAQTMVTVTMQDASTHVFNVSANGKLYFDNDQLVVIESFAQSAAINISDIRKVQFDSEEEDNISSIKKDNIVIYPNPTTGKVNISGLNGLPVEVSVYSSNGQLIIKKTVTSDETIDFGALKNGLYLLKINDSVYKISKI